MINQIKKWYRFLNPRFQNVFLDYKVDFKPRYPEGSPHPGLQNIISAQSAAIEEHVTRLATYREQLWEIKQFKDESDSHQPGWNNGFLPGLDIAALYYMLAQFKPGRYIEVGSGQSTKVAKKAINDCKLPTKITSIDPVPRFEINDLADKIIRKPFESQDLDVAEELEAGDILFIDNSHRILPNSDAMVFYLETLPRLKTGVIVHIHDVYLPYDYPQFMCDRVYNEQYGLAIALLTNPEKFEILMPNFFIFNNKNLHSQTRPLWEAPVMQNVEQHGGSFWFKIK